MVYYTFNRVQIYFSLLLRPHASKFESEFCGAHILLLGFLLHYYHYNTHNYKFWP